MQIVNEERPMKKPIQRGSLTEKLLPLLDKLKVDSNQCLKIVQADIPKNKIESVVYFVYTQVWVHRTKGQYKFFTQYITDKKGNNIGVKVWKISLKAKTNVDKTAKNTTGRGISKKKKK